MTISIKTPRQHAKRIKSFTGVNDVNRWASGVDDRLTEILHSLEGSSRAISLLTSSQPSFALTPHAIRHQPSGTDPLPTGAPDTALGGNSANAAGTSDAFSRSTHSHDVATAKHSGTWGATAAEGTGNALLRADCVLGADILPWADPPLLQYATVAAAGTPGSDEMIRSDATVLYPNAVMASSTLETLTLTDDATDLILTSSKASPAKLRFILPGTKLEVMGNLRCQVDSGVPRDCLELQQDNPATTSGVHINMLDRGSNPKVPATPAGKFWRNSTRLIMGFNTLRFGIDDDTDGTRTIQFVNGPSDGYEDGIAKFPRISELKWSPTTERTLTIPNYSDSSVKLPSDSTAGLIYDGCDNPGVIQTMGNKRFLDASTLFRNETDQEKGFRFQCEDITSPTPDLITDHVVLNVLAMSANPNEHNLIVHDLATLQDSTFFLYDDITPTKIATFQCSGLSETTRTFTFPDSDGTLALVETLGTVSGAQHSGGYAATGVEGSAETFIRSDETLVYPKALKSDANDATLTFADDATNTTLTSSLGRIDIVPAATGVVLGSASPTSALAHAGIGIAPRADRSVNCYLRSSTNGAGTLGFLMQPDGADMIGYGVFGQVQMRNIAGYTTGGAHRSYSAESIVRNTGNVLDEMTGFYSVASESGTDATTTIAKRYGLYVAGNPAGPTFTDTYGAFVANLAFGTARWAFYALADRSYFGGGYLMPDSAKGTYGTGQDAEVYYDGTDLVLDPDAVGAGIVLIGATGDDDMKLNEIEIDGDLNHDGSNIGFFGTAPAAQAAAYTPANVAADRSYNANATTIDELADVVGTLIADLQAYGLLQ